MSEQEKETERLKEEIVFVWGYQRGQPCFELIRKDLDALLKQNKL